MGEHTPDPAHRVETLLATASGGDRAAAAELLPLVYAELRKLAGARLAALPPGQTLQPTALVHEAYVRLVGKGDPGWNGRAHFFGAAARAMRNVLVDLARSKSRVKRGGDRDREAGTELAVTVGGAGGERQTLDVVSLSEAMDKLEGEDPLKAQIVGLRFFVGLGIDDTAKALGMAPATVDRHWAFAKAWLRRELTGGGNAPEELGRA